MRVLSLFDGCSGAMLALLNAGIYITEYHAFEIDKYAIQVSKANFPEIHHRGDVRDALTLFQTDGYFDLLIGGSPCQDLSIAGQRKGLKGERSGLFWEYVNCLRKLKPKYFLLENVASMKKCQQDIITETLRVEPIMINSALVTAQNRKRLYWTNIPQTGQPKDKGILLKDTINGNGIGFLKNHGVWKEKSDKSQCLDANYFKGVDNHGQRTMICEKSWNPEFKKNYLQWDKNKKGHKSQDQRAYFLDSKHGTLPSNGAESKVKVLLDVENLVYRKLTPLECERLQGIPDNYTNHVSNTQRYKMIGNGFTIPVIAHILKGMKC